MGRIANAIDRANGLVGRAVSWLALAMVLVQFAIVVARYAFGEGAIALQESVIAMHAALFMLAAAWTSSEGGHVRVDIFYASASPRGRALVDLLGALLLLLPMCAAILWAAWPYVSQAWSIHEGSRETSGLGGVYLLKTVILVFAVQLALQGLSMGVRAWAVLAGGSGSYGRSAP